MSAIQELIRAVAKDYADEILAETMLDQDVGSIEGTLDELGLAPDDGVDPVVPTGVVVTAGARALFVSWAQAPPADRVLITEIEVSAGNAVVRRLKEPHDKGAAYVDQLEASAGNTVTPAQHSVRVKHTDRYGRSSGWVGPILATPDPTFVDRLKADTVLAGRVEALVSVVSGGTIEAGGASLNPTGMELTNVATSLSAPDVSRGSKITPDVAIPFAAMNFFDIPDSSESYPKRGVHLRSDGSGLTSFRRGQVRLEATGNGVVGGVTHALMLIQGGINADADETYVLIRPHLEVQGTLKLPGNSVVSDAILGLAVGKVNGGGVGQKLDPDLLPGVDVRLLNGGGVSANIDPDLMPALSMIDGNLPFGRISGNLSGTRVSRKSLPPDRLAGKVPWDGVAHPVGLVNANYVDTVLDAREKKIYAVIAKHYQRK